jgi:ribosome-associated translation inhibitor RaiA
MKIEMKMRSLDRINGLRGCVEQELKDLQRELSIESAHVVLEQEGAKSPSCRASVWLVIPGPDLHAAASDHTILAAWRKVHGELKRQIRERKSHRTLRLKAHLQLCGNPRG